MSDLVLNDLAELNDLCQKHGIGQVGDPVIKSIAAFIEKHSAPVNPEPPQVSIVWYISAEKVYELFWEFVEKKEGMISRELMSGGLRDADGSKLFPTEEDDVKYIKDVGYWGWVDTDKNTVHAWAKEEFFAEQIVQLVARTYNLVAQYPAVE